MKTLFGLFMLLALPCWGANFQVKDILGIYENANKSGSPDNVEIKYNTDNELVIILDSGHEYPLDKDGANGTLLDDAVYSDDCDDPGCGELTYLKVTVNSQTKSGKQVPVLQMELTITYDYPESDEDPSGDVTTTETMVWVQAPEFVTPPYLKIAEPKQVSKLWASCKEFYVEKSLYSIEAGVCPQVTAYSFEDFDTAWKALSAPGTQVEMADLDHFVFEKWYLNFEKKALFSKKLYSLEDLKKPMVAFRNHIEKNSDYISWSSTDRSDTIYSVSLKYKTIVVYRFGDYYF